MKSFEQKLYTIHNSYKEQGLVDKESAPKEPSVKSDDVEMEQIPSSSSIIPTKE